MIQPWWKTRYKEAYTNAKEKGWWETSTKADIYLQLILIGTEVMEAIEDLRKNRMDTIVLPTGKREGFWTEVSDVAIRSMELLYFLESKGLNKTQDYVEEMDKKALDQFCIPWMQRTFGDKPIPKEIEQAIILNHMYLGLFDGSIPVEDRLKTILYECFDFGQRYDGNLETEIDEKMKANNLRTYRHGGKKF